MNAIVEVEIPQDFQKVLAAERGERALSRLALEALVLEAVREGWISRGRGAEILGLSFYQGEEFYAEHGVDYNITLADVEADRKAIDVLLGKPC